MDPFKTLGVAPRPIKCQSDLEKLRKQAKKKFARHMKEKNKFEAKKVLEAFEAIKKKTNDSENKILGRTRKERELDKHFNHQTKEIKKNKPLQRHLRKERKGGEKIHLPGDKERVGIRRRARPSKAAVGVLHGLQRLKMSLPHRSKFAKVMQLVYRWCKEYMDADNREYVFQVLQEAVDTGFVATDTEGRQIVIQIFEYVLSYWKDWFEQSEDNQMLARYWRISTILVCRCSTDDSFTFTSTVAGLVELLEFLRENQHRLRSKGEFSDAGSVESDGDAEEGVRIFAAPSAERSLSHIREHFVDSCMAALFQTRTNAWARSRVDSFFQDVYYKRDVFTATQFTQIEAWQARIKVLQKSAEHAVGEANNPLKAQRLVVDSREWSTSVVSAGDAWAEKQTFDAQDIFGGSKTFR